MRAFLVEIVKRRGEVRARDIRGKRPRRGFTVALASGKPRGLGCRQPLGEVMLHGPDALHIRGRIEPQASVGSLGKQQSVAALPRTEPIPADAGALASFADSNDALCGHPPTTVQPLDKR